jgi:hypothetical protein
MSAGRSTPGEKLAAVFRSMKNDSSGEAIAAVNAMNRILKSAGMDIHQLADHIQNIGLGAKLSDEEMQKLYDAGIADGRLAVQNEQTNGRVPQKPNGSSRQSNDPTELVETWNNIANYCLQKSARLYDKEKGFVRGMADQTDDGNMPSVKQRKWLYQIFQRLGGTPEQIMTS